MLKTIKELMELMSSHKKQLYISLILSFVDSVLFVVPIVIAFCIVGSIPELCPLTLTPLTSLMVIKYTVGMLICILIRIVLRYVTLKQRSGVCYNVMCKERKILGQKLRKVSLGYFNQKNLGDLLSTITSDTGFLEIEGMGVVEKAAVGIPTLIIGLAILLFFNYRTAIATIILLIPTYFAYRYLATTQDRLKLNRQEEIAVVTEDTVEFIKGLSVLKTYNMEEKQFYKTKNSFRHLSKLSLKIEFAHIPPAALYQLCFRAIITVIILITGISMIKGELTFKSAFILMLGSLSMFTGVEVLGIYSIFSKMTQHSIDRINSIKNISKMDDALGNERVDNYEIVFENVTFAYETNPVLSNVDFIVPEKSTTALVGLSGSGKTTITNLVARFWDVTKGKVMIGGKDVRSISYEELLKNISFVFQNAFLFDDTVMNNIRIGKLDASDDEVKQAARKARCHEFIYKMENGYNTMVGEAGLRLSGGERQRISIARALIKDSPIVLLDEVTASVDVENESQIQVALEELLKDRTVIIIAHKLNTIQHVNQILVIENSKIIQKGTHSELVNVEGTYKKLWDIQCQTGKWKL